MTTFTRVERRQTVTTTTVWTGDDPPTASIETRSVTRYDVTDAPPVPMHSEARGRLYVPVKVTVDHTRGSNPHVTVTGRLRRKDGSLGEIEYEIHRFGWRRGDWPAWLNDLAADAAQLTNWPTS